MTRLRQFSQAIGQMEGYYVTKAQAAARHISWPTLPQKLFNPGDLIYVGQHGATPFSVVGGDGKLRTYCQFKTEDVGFTACDFQLTLYAGRKLTVQQSINKWAPSDDGNNPASYTAGVCKLLGCKPTDLLSVVVAETQPKPPIVTYIVKAGDTLGKIAAAFYGSSSQYMKIFNANQFVLTDPNRVSVGMMLIIP